MILLVTNDPATLRSIRAVAAELDMPLIHARTGIYAVAELLQTRFAMIIVTHDLIDLSHDAFTSYVRRLDQRVPIVSARRRGRHALARSLRFAA